LRALGVNVLLLLVEDHELANCRVQAITDVLPASGGEVVRFPIVDPWLPDDPDAFAAVIADLLDRVRGGDFLAIACRGGLDRSGLAAGCLLRGGGLSADEAIDRVHAARRGSLTIPAQQDFVRAWNATQR
jgi:protein-tyrosine phosphatase